MSLRAAARPSGRVFFGCRALVLLVLLSPATAPAQTEEGVGTPVDRIVAVVDEDPILRSDMDRTIRLGLVVPDVEESEADFERRVLDEIIIHRLRSHEVDRFGGQDLPLSEVEAQYDQIRGRYDDEEAFETALAEVGLDPDGLRELLARQLMVLSYVEDRLGPRVFVSLDDIQGYYDEVLSPEMERRRQPLPPLAEVREQIRAVLRQQRLNEELDAWTEELRLQADIIDYLERPERALPPPVR